jgi:general secretion pathway protein G
MEGEAMRLRKNVNRGFTLVELMVVIVILGIIGTMAFVFVLDKPDKAKWDTAKVQMASMVEALNQYAVDHDNSYPESLEGIAKQYGGKLPKDPFTKDNFLYELAGDDGFFLRCLGKDRQDGGAEVPDKDIVFNKYGYQEESP